jgi:2'-5' RNA ligase
MTPVRWLGYYDVVILPPPPLRDYAIQLSRELRRSGGRWSLGKRSFLPHISLYHIPVAPPELGAFKRDVAHLAESAEWGALETTGFDMPLLMLDKPAWLSDLHRKLVRRTVRYFDWNYGAENTWDLHWFSGKRLEVARRYLQEYGSPMIGANFRPHITLTSFKGAGEPEKIQFDIKKMRFRAAGLHICELGESHSCQRIVR